MEAQHHHQPAGTAQRYSFVDLGQLQSETSSVPMAQKFDRAHESRHAAETVAAAAFNARVELTTGLRVNKNSENDTGVLFSGRAPSKRWKPTTEESTNSHDRPRGSPHSSSSSSSSSGVSSAVAYAHSRTSPAVRAANSFLVSGEAQEPQHHDHGRHEKHGSSPEGEAKGSANSSSNNNSNNNSSGGAYLLKEPMSVFSRHLVSTDGLSSAAPIGDASHAFGSRPWSASSPSSSPSSSSSSSAALNNAFDSSMGGGGGGSIDAMKLFEALKQEQLQKMLQEEERADAIRREQELTSSPYRATYHNHHNSNLHQQQQELLSAPRPGAFVVDSVASLLGNLHLEQEEGRYDRGDGSNKDEENDRFRDTLVPPAFSASSSYRQAAERDASNAQLLAAASQFSRFEVEPAGTDLAHLLAGLSTVITPAAVMQPLPPPRAATMDAADDAPTPTPTGNGNGSASVNGSRQASPQRLLQRPRDTSTDLSGAASGSPGVVPGGVGSCVLRADAVRLPASSGPCFSSSLWDAYRSSDSLLLTTGLGTPLEALQRAGRP